MREGEKARGRVGESERARGGRRGEREHRRKLPGLYHRPTAGALKPLQGARGLPTPTSDMAVGSGHGPDRYHGRTSAPLQLRGSVDLEARLGVR